MICYYLLKKMMDVHMASIDDSIFKTHAPKEVDYDQHSYRSR